MNVGVPSGMAGASRWARSAILSSIRISSASSDSPVLSNFEITASRCCRAEEARAAMWLPVVRQCAPPFSGERNGGSDRSFHDSAQQARPQMGTAHHVGGQLVQSGTRARAQTTGHRRNTTSDDTHQNLRTNSARAASQSSVPNMAPPSQCNSKPCNKTPRICQTTLFRLLLRAIPASVICVSLLCAIMRCDCSSNLNLITVHSPGADL